MNVLLISQCEKNALTETRRIIDQFAERRGDRVWQTAITQQGLDTLRRMLKKTARKNTAVACHWIRGLNHSELVWIVGAADRFNEKGAVPTNATQRKILRSGDEHDWSGAERVRTLAALAALWHDVGKASATFQKKLKSKKPIADPLRHEWVSLRLLQAYIGDDDDRGWLGRLATLPDHEDLAWLSRLERDEDLGRLTSPFKGTKLPPLARAMGWLIASHHRLPVQRWKEEKPHPDDLRRLPGGITAAWCGANGGGDDEEPARERQQRLLGCHDFTAGLPVASAPWRERARKHARRALADAGFVDGDWLASLDPYTLHLSRLVLVLADHHYSSLTDERRRVRGSDDCQLVANTLRKTGKPNQKLDEHLIGVEIETGRIVHGLPSLAWQLPRVARHKGFVRRTREARFAWQNSAYDLAASLREHSAEQGFFGINMASTGLGKTLANGRILYALSDPVLGARFTIALGLRTLTLQTGEAYRDRLKLGSDDLAVLVGGGLARELYEHTHAQGTPSSAAVDGSESASELLDDQSYVHYEGSLVDGPLREWLAHTRGAPALVQAPVLACTIDHLVPATESLRGGRQIAPMLRLMTSDLVLDEPDDFGLEDLPALARLVHWAGLLGTRLLLSSATLPPSLVQGLFEAYLQGRRSHRANHTRQDQDVGPVVAWFDEFACEAHEPAGAEAFAALHRDWATRRCQHLAGSGEQRRRATIVDVQPATEAVEQDLARLIIEQAHALHAQHHVTDPRSQKRVSFGLVRLANITPLVEVTRAIATLGAQPGHRLHLVCYHSQHPLLVRSQIEQRLDRWLMRLKPQEIFTDEALREELDCTDVAEHLFLVLATPVAEVGRDHDYDWAIVEPSSMRSIIQLAGRVRRHRAGTVAHPNLVLLDHNLRALNGEKPAFCRPGFESAEFPLQSHALHEILRDEQLARIDATARVLERETLEPQTDLADLEHARLRATMLGDGTARTREASLWWQTPAHLSGELQRSQPFRRDNRCMHRYALELDEEGETVRFVRHEEDGDRTEQDNLLHVADLSAGVARSVSFAAGESYPVQVQEMAKKMGMEVDECARRFGVIDLPERGAEQGYNYHPALGLWRRT